MRRTLSVWFLAPEVAPFAKTGGLADVAGALPGALKNLDVDVRVAVPLYRMVKEGDFPMQRFFSGLEVPLGNETLKCDILETGTDQGVPVYLFDRGDLFDRSGLYGTAQGDYSDNLERFAFFTRAALLLAKRAGLHFDVVHCHDWQTGLAPVYLKRLYREDAFFSSAASVFTVHNMGYQGLFPAEKLSVCGLPASEFHPEGLEYWGNISLLKAGLVYADAITTVSPRYSREIQTPEFGMGMDAILRNRSADLHGIINGADYHTWNPATDPKIPAHYGIGHMDGKRACKAALAHTLGLDPRFLARPLLAVVSRLTVQKGHDLLLEIIPDVVGLDVALVILGAGEQKYQQALGLLGQKYPERLAVRVGFDEDLAHQIMAGADMLLAPSRYEPCGLTQIYALKYGTVPVAPAIGGFDDTIVQFDSTSGQGTGFKFLNHDPGTVLHQIREAVQTYQDKALWKKLVRNAMKADFSWTESARKYVALYEQVRQRRQKPNAGSY
jgi:starch synthase